MNRFLFVFLSLAVVLSAQSPLAAPANAEDGAGSVDKVAYKTIGNRQLAFEIDKPAAWRATDRRAAIVFFFGGGWKNGSTKQFESQARFLAERGMVSLRADYRVRSRDGVLPTQCVEDAVDALRWVRAHAAQLGVDPEKIVAAGGSAGGHLALCTALAEDCGSAEGVVAPSSRPNALLLYNPVVDLVALKGEGRDADLVAGLDAEAAKRISPAYRISRALPPVLVMTGTADRFCPQIRDFVGKAREAGASVEAFYADGETHGFFNRSPWLERTTEMAEAFLRKLGYLDPVAENGALVDYVDPFLGTAPLLKVEDIGFEPPWRVWAGLTFPGASLPNAMVQLSPITKFGSGAGYEYEDTVIRAFAHTNKGHWNLCYVPVLPVVGKVDPEDFGSRFSHDREEARPGYYRVRLERYGIDVELTTTLRCGFHRYVYPAGRERKLVVNLPVSNERVSAWNIRQTGPSAFAGWQDAREKVFFYAEANSPVSGIENVKGRAQDLPIVAFAAAEGPLELRIGLSFVSIENAKLNLDRELAGRSFSAVREEAGRTWEALLSKIRVSGGTERQRRLFYSCLYRSFLWPALRSDANGEFANEKGRVVRKNFAYYTVPSLWDDYRNKLVLLGLLEPKVAEDVIQSLVDRGEATGFMPTFFHGDHAAAFVAGSYLRGLRGYDVRSAYRLLLRNATVENPHARPFLAEYAAKGYVSTAAVERPKVETKGKAGVTKTLEYAYDDYAVALLGRELGDEENSRMLMKRARNYANVFDRGTGLMRGRRADGSWVEPFDPQFPYYEYMYREANAWQSSFFAPHDTEGLIALYPDRHAFERQLDLLFGTPWNPKYIAMNVNSFIGQYCHGNQPDHGFPYLYYWVGKQEKTQRILDEIMERFYGMDGGRTLCGMDDAGEMSSWYVFNAIGLYPYSPADPNYVVTVPLFESVALDLGSNRYAIVKKGTGEKIGRILCDERELHGFLLDHRELMHGGKLSILMAEKPAAAVP